MRKVTVALVILALAVPAMAVNIQVKFDGTDPAGTITNGAGPAGAVTTDGTNTFFRKYQINGWNYSSMGANFPGGAVDMSAGNISFEMWARFYQDAQTNTKPYDDAPIGVYLRDATGKQYGLGWLYQAKTLPAEERFPTWQKMTAAIPVFNNATAPWPTSVDFDATKVTGIRFFTTDWTTPGGTTADPNVYDFIDVRDMVITPEPMSALLLGLGGLLLRRRRA